MGKGIDIRATGAGQAGAILIDAELVDVDGNPVTSGTTTLSIFELQDDDGTLETLDFNDSTFKATTTTTPTANMTHRQGDNGNINTGLWTYRFSDGTPFTKGRIYYQLVQNANASPPRQMRKWQYGGAEGDILIDEVTAGQHYVQADAQLLDTDSPSVTVAAGVDASNDITSILSAVATVDMVVDGIKAVTDNLPDAGALTSIAQASSLPTNFADLSITATTGRVDVALIEGSDATDQIRDAIVDDATRIDASALNTAAVTTIPALESSMTLLLSGVTTIDTVVDAIKAVTDAIPDSGAMTSIAQESSLPTNFADLSITPTTGRVDVGQIEGADATDQIRDAVVDDGTRIDASALNTVIGNLPDSGALTSIAQAAALATTDGKIDTIDGLIDALIAGTSKVALRSDGLDAVDIETGVNARQAISAVSSACCGVLAGAGSTSITIAAIGNPGTNRLSATVDSAGNRTVVTPSLPS